MTNTAIKSSITAKAVKNTVKPTGTRLPKREITPIAKAISVAVGIAQPLGSTEPAIK